MGQRRHKVLQAMFIQPMMEDAGTLEKDTLRDHAPENDLARTGINNEDQLKRPEQKQRSPSQLGLEQLPNELLSYIISFLDVEPPSTQKLNQDPSLELTVSEVKALKTLSRTSHFFRQISLPRLFRYSRVKTISYKVLVNDHLHWVAFFIDMIESYLSFLRNNNILRHVESLVVYIDTPPSDALREIVTVQKATSIWQCILPHINPQSVTIIGEPLYLARSMLCGLSILHQWAFDMPIQIVRVSRSPGPSNPAEHAHDPSAAGLLDARPWTHLSLNEGSALPAYRSYEYYLKITPSLLGTRPRETVSPPLLALSSTLTSLHYTATFPFYSHVDDVLKYAKAMPLLEKLSLQLVPGEESTAFDDPTRTAKVSLEDRWLEVDTGYELVVHAVMEMGRREGGRLRVFESWDCGVEDVKVGLERRFEELGAFVGWRCCGVGVWSCCGDAESKWEKCTEVPGWV